jgi:hypothetical protein
MIDFDEIKKTIAIEHNILLDKDDPALISITLQGLVFQRYVELLMAENMKYRQAIDTALQKGIADAKVTAGRVITEAADYVSEQAHTAVTAALEEGLIQVRKELLEAKKEVQTVRHTAASVLLFCTIMIIFALFKIVYS